MPAQKRCPRPWGLVVLLVVVGLLRPTVARGQVTHTWIGPYPGDFETLSNWTPATAFAPGDTRYIGPAKSVYWAGSSFDLYHGQIVQVKGGDLEASNILPGETLVVGSYHSGVSGDADVAELSLQNGATLSVSNFVNIPYLNIGHGGEGHVRLSGGSSISGSNDRGVFANIRIGLSDGGRTCTGVLEINDAPGHAGIDAGNIYIGNDAGCLGRMLLGGTTYTYTGEAVVGYHGEGDLSLSGSAVLTRRTGVPSTGERFQVGYGIGSEGTVWLNDTAEMSTDSAYVGLLGKGTVEVTDASKWGIAGEVCIGGYDTSVGKVWVGNENSPDTVSLEQTLGGGSTPHAFYVGSAGCGELRMEGRSTARLHHVIVGSQTTGDGDVSLSGTHVALTCTSLKVDSGEFGVWDGARVDYDDTLSAHWKGMKIGSFPSSAVRAQVLVAQEGSTLDLRGQALNVGDGAKTGDLRVDWGGTVRCGALTVNSTAVGEDQAYVWVHGFGWATNPSTAHCTGLVVGSDATGRMDIIDGGVVRVSGQTTVGMMPGSDGSIRFKDDSFYPGGGKLFLSDRLSVGMFGKGSVSVYDGGTLESKDCFVGDMAGSSGSLFVNGVDSLWTADGAVAIGQFGRGSLVVESTGEVTATTMTIGSYIGGDGFARVGSGSRMTTQTLDIGYEARGRMIVLAGGYVNVKKDVRLGVASGGDGTLTVDGEGTSCLIEGDLAIGGIAPPGGIPGQIVDTPSAALVEVRKQAELTVKGNMVVWGDGTLRVKSGATVTIQGVQLTFKNKAKFEEYGGTIELLGTNVVIENDTPSDLAGLAGTTLVFAGGNGVLDTIEVAGVSGSAGWDAFYDNFTIGRIVVGSDGTEGHVQLIDALANQRGASGPPESLFVKELVVRGGSSIDFGGIDVICQSIVNQGGTIIQGDATLTQIPAIGSADGAMANVQYYPGNPDTSGAGILSIEDLCDVTFHTADASEVHPSSHLQLMTTLVADRSVGGRADGLFIGGTFALYDVFGTPLWSGYIVDLSLVERDDASGVMDGLALIELTGGEYGEGFAMPLGEYVEMTFCLDAGDQEDFAAAFGGGGNFAIGPVLPEPASLALVTVGGLALLRRKNR